MKLILPLLAVFVHIASFSQTVTTTVCGTWYVCGNFDLQDQTESIAFTKLIPSCESYGCARNEWTFKEDSEIEFSWSGGCNGVIDGMYIKPAKWDIDLEKETLILNYKDSTFVQFDIVHLDYDTLIIKRIK